MQSHMAGYGKTEGITMPGQLTTPFNLASLVFPSLHLTALCNSSEKMGCSFTCAVIQNCSPHNSCFLFLKSPLEHVSNL